MRSVPPTKGKPGAAEGGPILGLADFIAFLGSLTLFNLSAIRWLFYRPPRWRNLMPLFFSIGVSSTWVVGLTGCFIGMVLAVQSYHSFREMGLETRMGAVINVTLVKELGPVLAATMLAGRVGSAMAAELGTMRVTDQIDALSALGTNPIQVLVVPRLVTCVLLIPLLTSIADCLGILGGYVISTTLFGIDSYYYWFYTEKFVEFADLFAGMFKSVFFGYTIGIIACHRGFHSRAGAQGVGQAATEAFVLSFVIILAIDLVIGSAWNSVYRALYPGVPEGLI
ncbi:MAG: MlaE family ABC transporter permease [bacterium]